ncbi:hypothetical protein D3C76_921000 [compost metagenome]
MGEGLGLGGALHLYDATVFGHHHVHVGLGGGIFHVLQIADGFALIHADGDGRDHLLERALLEHALLDHPVQRIHQGHAGACDGGGAGAAVGLQHVTVHSDGVLAEGGQIHGGTQGAGDQPGDLQGAAALLAGGRLAVHARMGGARQHAVLGGDPALALAFQEARHAGVDAGGAQHAGVAELHQHRSFRMLGEVAGDGNRAHLRGTAIAGTGHGTDLWAG